MNIVSHGGFDMTDDVSDGWRTQAQRENDIAQAKALREQAAKGGLSFEVFLPSGMAEWILDYVERGVFIDPSEAVFVMLGEYQDYELHEDLREEVLRRSLQASMDQADEGIPAETFFAQLKEDLKKPRPPVAVWQKQKYE